MRLIQPDWPAPFNVKAWCTTRIGGSGQGEYRGFNIAQHVGDDAKQVHANRARLPFAEHIQWLDQQHTNRALELNSLSVNPPRADASFTTRTDIACAVMTADCLPVLLCNQQGTFVAAIHAGWRGLASGIIEHTLQQSAQSPASLMAWLGPAISQAHFEVGEEVKSAFADHSSAVAATAKPGKYLACLHTIARQKLLRNGVDQIYHDTGCTYADDKRFYSYRRATHMGHKNTGRMLSCIVII